MKKLWDPDMLSPAQMKAVAEHYEQTPCEWLWNDCDSSGPNLLNRFINLCHGINHYLENSLFQPDMDMALRPYGRTDFDPVPSQGVIVSLALLSKQIDDILEAESYFSDLMDYENRKADVPEKFIGIAVKFIWFAKALEGDVRVKELKQWIEEIGWNELVWLAANRDMAALELRAGRAFCGSEGGIARLPADWSRHAAA